VQRHVRSLDVTCDLTVHARVAATGLSAHEPHTRAADRPTSRRELDALAADFERARQQTLFSSDWEPRFVAVALALRELITHHPRHRWDRLFLRRPRAYLLTAIDTTVITPKTPAEMQRRALERMRGPRAQASLADGDRVMPAKRYGEQIVAHEPDRVVRRPSVLSELTRILYRFCTHLSRSRVFERDQTGLR
jgi:hypothetical protein